jgi:hypothetical protein
LREKIAWEYLRTERLGENVLLNGMMGWEDGENNIIIGSTTCTSHHISWG